MAIEKVVNIKLEVDSGKSVKDLKTIEEQLILIEKDVRNISKKDALSGAERNFNTLNKIVDESA